MPNDPLRCETCEGNGTLATPYSKGCPAYWAHDLLGMTLPNALPEPTAPQDGEQSLSSERKEVRELTDAQLVSASDLLPMMLRATGQTTGSVIVEEFRSRLSSLSTELVRVRGALGLAATRLEILTGRMRGCHEETGMHELMDEAEMFCEEARAALGGLVPPDASPRRTE